MIRTTTARRALLLATATASVSSLTIRGHVGVANRG